MAFDRGDKAVANERKYPFIVEACIGCRIEPPDCCFSRPPRRIRPYLDAPFGETSNAIFDGAFPISTRRAALSKSLAERFTEQPAAASALTIC
jgi:hypothetical protein